MTKSIIKFICYASGALSSIDGLYLVRYDPTIKDGVFFLDTTDDPRKAKTFDPPGLAMEEWMRVSPNMPTRLWDGKPNRPLTAWSIEIIDLDMALREAQK